MTRPNRSDFDRLRKLIEHGWCKLNDDGSHTNAGEPPFYDLYWAVRALDRRFPVQPNLDPIFLKLAHTIAELYPDRVREPEIDNQYTARIIVFEFNDNPNTSQQDVLRVLAVAAEMQPKRLVNGED
jgi:hypothetical protein